MSENDYLLLSDAEKSRLQLQAQVWEPEAGRLFDQIGVQAGWHCLDVGCGAMGVLGALSQRVGRNGRVVGLEMADDLYAAAQQYVADEKLTNVALHQGDAHQSGLVSDTFDLVHERFVLPHVPNPAALLQEMIRLAKSGGIVIMQEPDHSSWNFWPPCPEWPSLLRILEAALGLRGDINIGRRTYQLAQEAGLENVQIRAGVVALQASHPYMHMPLVAAAAMRSHILSAGLAEKDELDALVTAVSEHINNPAITMITFTTTQVWGQKPNLYISRSSF